VDWWASGWWYNNKRLGVVSGKLKHCIAKIWVVKLWKCNYICKPGWLCGELSICICKLGWLCGKNDFLIWELGWLCVKINFFIRKLGLFDKILDKKVLKIAKNMKFKIYSTKEDKIRQK